MAIEISLLNSKASGCYPRRDATPILLADANQLREGIVLNLPSIACRGQLKEHI